MFCRQIVVVLCLLAVLGRFALAVSLTEDFSSNPFSHWSFGIADNSHTQFVWDAAAPPPPYPKPCSPH